MVSYLEKGVSCGEVAEWFNAAGSKKKSVSLVILASEVQILPSPLLGECR